MKSLSGTREDARRTSPERNTGARPMRHLYIYIYMYMGVLYICIYFVRLYDVIVFTLARSSGESTFPKKVRARVIISALTHFIQHSLKAALINTNVLD